MEPNYSFGGSKSTAELDFWIFDRFFFLRKINLRLWNHHSIQNKFISTFLSFWGGLSKNHRWLWDDWYTILKTEKPVILILSEKVCFLQKKSIKNNFKCSKINTTRVERSFFAMFLKFYASSFLGSAKIILYSVVNFSVSQPYRDFYYTLKQSLFYAWSVYSIAM